MKMNMQVVLNFLTNSVDIFASREIKNPKIDIVIDILEDKSILKVIDNAGGIKEENINNVFNAYYSTKKRGSGIGLYICHNLLFKHILMEI